MRPSLIVAVALAAAALACAGARPVAERPAGHALPEPDPGCRMTVASSLVLTGVERVTVRVAAVGAAPSVEVLSPELTPAQAEEVRRAFAACIWRPGADGATSGTVTFTRATAAPR